MLLGQTLYTLYHGEIETLTVIGETLDNQYYICYADGFKPSYTSLKDDLETKALIGGSMCVVIRDKAFCCETAEEANRMKIGLL